MTTLELKHYDTYISLFTKCSYIQLDDEFNPMSVKHQLNVKDERHGTLVVHDEDFNVRIDYSKKAIQNCNAWVHNWHATICPSLHGSCFALLLMRWAHGKLITFETMDLSSLFLCILSYREICLCCKSHSLQSIYYTLKNYWGFSSSMF